jgi:hypothetical protein
MLAAVKKTPPYLKHLAESRARAAGEVSRRREIVQDAVASSGMRDCLGTVCGRLGCDMFELQRDTTARGVGLETVCSCESRL